MLTREMNGRLTQVGAGTPAGELLRRYWWPIATVAELDIEPVLAVTLLGENLALYRTDAGELGLVAQRCPHRGASLAYGIPEQDGLRCPYHGWKFNASGHCLEQPAEPADSTFKDRVRIPAYPVHELGGLAWAYLGPQPVPLLPRWDLLVRDDLRREIGWTRLPINWLQAVENTMDPVHLEHLHGKYMNFVLGRAGKPAGSVNRHHLEIAFDVWEFGISKRRLLEGDDPQTSEEWLVGHPLLFPAHLALGNEQGPRFEFRVPVDDTHLLVYSYFTVPYASDEARQTSIPTYEIPYKHADGRLIVDTVLGQDMMAWITQGDVTDRTTERLGASDRGIILYRQVLLEQIERVERGEDPMGVIRDPARHTPFLSVPRERAAFFTHAGGMVAQPEIYAEDPLAFVRGKRGG
jgi:5,5'-dehydrodivanillate O-demethylase oxygenase subunit